MSVVESVERSTLRARIERDSAADQSSLRTGTDQTLSIGTDVWRLRWCDQATTAVTEDAGLHTTCGALLDALAIFESAPPGIYDDGAVNVLIDRPLPGPKPSEVDQALRSLRDTVSGIRARIWYRGGDSEPWREDTEAPPRWPVGNDTVEGWLTKYLMPRLRATPGRLATAVVEAVSDPSLHLYPSEITDTVSDRWALRIDGLEVGTVGPVSGVLTVGKPGKAGVISSQRQAFTDIFEASEVTVALDPAPGELGVQDAATRLRALLRHWRAADVPGLPVTHRTKGKTPIIDEHTLEARVLKGLVHWPTGGGSGSQLVLGDGEVARGSQFPTQWGHGAKARFLDALLVDGTTPVAVELKVATGGQGRYYRRSLTQAVLYRHFVHHAPGVERWFVAAGLDRTATRGAIGIPQPERWTPQFERDVNLLRRIAARVGVEVQILDPRAMPERNDQDRPEPSPDEVLRLSWRLAGALAARWPTELGSAVEAHTADIYDELHLRHVRDRTLSSPSRSVRLSLNRPGSLWIWSQTGAARWVWRGIWNHLHAQGDVDAAAEIIGAVAGFPEPCPTRPASFPQLAAVFLAAVAQPRGWDWRSVWTAGDHGARRSPFARIINRYRSESPTSELPTRARLWVASHGSKAVLIDQHNLRVWISHFGTVLEMHQAEPLERVRTAAALVSQEEA